MSGELDVQSQEGSFQPTVARGTLAPSLPPAGSSPGAHSLVSRISTSTKGDGLSSPTRGGAQRNNDYPATERVGKPPRVTQPGRSKVWDPNPVSLAQNQAFNTELHSATFSLYFVLFFKAIMASSYTHPSLYLALYNLAICSEYRRGSFAMKKKCKSTSFHSLLPPSTFFLTQNPYSGGKKAPATCYKSNSLPGPMGSSYLTGPGQAPGVSVTVFLVAQKTVPSCKSGPSPEDQVEVPAAAGLPMTSGQATLPWLSKQVALGTQPGEVCHSALLPPSTYS